MPNSQLVQFVMLGGSSVLFATAFLLGLHHMRRMSALAGAAGQGLPHEAPMGPPARATVALATVVAVALLIWRTAAAQALPVSNPFDTFLVLGILLSLLVMYFRRFTRHLRSMSFFLLPMIVVLLVLGLVLAAVHAGGQAEAQSAHDAWATVHVVTVVAGTVCFALGCVGGVLYLLADRQLRRRGLDASHRWIGLPPLASIEKFSQWMIYCGFPLLTVATFAGILWVLQERSQAHPPGVGQWVKIGFGLLSWLVYGVLLHVPLNPRLRGRRAAWLSIAGFVLFIGAFAAAKWS